MRCARCGNPRAALSLRLGEVVCWRHYHESFTAAEVREVERIVRQREIADAIRGVADRLRGDRARALSDRALLIHAADSEAEVAELVAEVDALGVELENDELPEISGAGSASHRAAMGWIGERFPGGQPPMKARDKWAQVEDARKGRDGAPAGDRNGPEPRTLAELVEMFEDRLYLPDSGIVVVSLGAVAANHLPGDPVWLINVGPPSSGKTEVLIATTVLPDIHLVSTLTEAALLSGTPRKERAQGASGGLLREIGEFGLIVCKDLTSILSMRHDTQAEVLGALREVYDGQYTRRVGTEGGRMLSWSGKAGLLAGCTETIDRRHGVMAAMGERFTLYRHGRPDPKEQARHALRIAGTEDEMRRELREAVAGLFCNGLPLEPRPLTEDENERLITLAAFAVRCRSAVERDGYSREIELVPHAELPARLVKVLARMMAGLDAIGAERRQSWKLVAKMALDSIPALRLAVIKTLSESGELATDAIGVAVGHPTQTTRRALEDLEAHGIVARDTAGKAHSWSLSDWCQGELHELSRFSDW